MEINDILTPENVLVSVRATSKKQALQELAKHAAQATGLPERQVFDVLLERERLGTTGVGRGIAIPHGKLEELDKLCGVFATLDQPVDFDSVDDQPVDLLFLLLAPESAGAEHLKALARISRLMRDAALCERIRDASGPDELYKMLTARTTSHAAA